MCVLSPAKGREGLYLSKHGGSDRPAVAHGTLTKLSAEHREIIDLVYYHEQSVDEAAQVLGIRAATVKTRMFYARKKLAEWIKAAEKSLGMGLRLLSA
jgi:hypothetical protein